jgi:hypothetical protein
MYMYVFMFECTNIYMYLYVWDNKSLRLIDLCTYRCISLGADGEVILWNTLTKDYGMISYTCTYTCIYITVLWM